MSAPSARRVTAQLAVARAAARVPLALLPLTIIYVLGVSAATDCFFLAYSAVTFAVSSFAPLLETAVVPFVAEARAAGEARGLVSAIFRRVLFISAPLSLCIAVAALMSRWARWPSTPGWQAGWVHLLLLSGLPLLNGAASVLSGYLNAEEWFLTGACAALVRGTVALVFGLLLERSFGVTAFSAGLLAGEIAALIWLGAARPSRSIRMQKPSSSPAVKEFWTLFLSMVVGGFGNASKGFVDRLIATRVGVGAVSILEFSERLFLMAMSCIGAPFVTVALSRWSAAFSGSGQRSLNQLRSSVWRSQRIALVLGICVLCFYPVVIFGPVARVLLRRFSAAELNVARLTLTMYMLGAVPYLLGLLTTQAIVIVRDSRFVAAAALAAAALNIALDLLGSFVAGVVGIAATTSVLSLLSWMAAELRLRSHAKRLVPAMAPTPGPA